MRFVGLHFLFIGACDRTNLVHTCTIVLVSACANRMYTNTLMASLRAHDSAI